MHDVLSLKFKATKTKFIYSTNLKLKLKLRETEAERRGRRRRTTKRGNGEARSSKGERAQAMLDRRGGSFGGEKSGHEPEDEVRSSERGFQYSMGDWWRCLLLVGRERERVLAGFELGLGGVDTWPVTTQSQNSPKLLYL